MPLVLEARELELGSQAQVQGAERSSGTTEGRALEPGVTVQRSLPEPRTAGGLA